MMLDVEELIADLRRADIGLMDEAAGMIEQLRDVAHKWEAIRQTVNCPTCGGVGWVVVGQTYSDPCGEQQQCPDCTDGKIDMARLLAVGAATMLADPNHRKWACYDLAREAVRDCLDNLQAVRP